MTPAKRVRAADCRTAGDGEPDYRLGHTDLRKSSPGALYDSAGGRARGHRPRGVALLLDACWGAPYPPPQSQELRYFGRDTRFGLAPAETAAPAAACLYVTFKSLD
jgi:hypothetical protein